LVEAERRRHAIQKRNEKAFIEEKIFRHLHQTPIPGGIFELTVAANRAAFMMATKEKTKRKLNY